MSVSAWILLGIVVAASLWCVVSYNRLVAMRQQCNQAFADIDVQLKRRHDLIPSLIETVRGYASHESATLEGVVQARNAAVAAEGPTAKAQAETMLGGALRQLFALAEAYPDLKANSNFQQLQTALSGIENSLAATRRAFNAMVQGYNSAIQQFPTLLFARIFGFTPHQFFGLGDERQTLARAPEVKF